MRCVWNICKNEIKHSLNNKMIFLFILFSLFAVPFMNIFNFFSSGTEMKIIKDITFSLVSTIGIIVSIFYPIYSIKEDLERKYIYNIFSRPVSRINYIIGKYVGLCLVVTIICFLNFVVLYTFLTLKGAEITLSFIFASFILMMKFYIMIAISIFLSLTQLSIHICNITSIFIFVIGAVKNYIQSAIQLADPTFEIKLAKKILLVFPNFQIFDVYEKIIVGQAFSLDVFTKTIIYACCYILSFFFLTCLIIRKKEV
ncbi:MAG: ABC transporter permease [Candidatus Aureabacteria bacterium]|nr:ABC transporter permease [Candidatus Auribacterota bacterium]